MKRRIILASLVVAALAAAGTAYAVVSQAPATQTVNACVNDDGQLRLAPASGSCKKNEQLLTWNTTGPIGPVGPSGAAGAAGPAGPQGAAGRDGRDATSSSANPDAVTGAITVTGARSGKVADAVAIATVSHEIVSPRDAGSGLATGRRQHKPFHITMEWGASTPRLLNIMTSNERASVVVSLSRGGTAFATVKLTNADIVDYQEHGDNATFEFTYEKIEWTYLDGGITVEDDWTLQS
jgi:type VI secretion system secreted protein Hcp